MSLLQDRRNLALLRRFTTILAVSLLALYGIVCVSPLLDLWFKAVAALPDDLRDFVRAPVLILVFSAPLAALLSLYRGLQIVEGRTAVITQAVVINVVCLAVAMVAGVSQASFSGVALAAAATTVATLAEGIFLRARSHRMLHPRP